LAGFGGWLETLLERRGLPGMAVAVTDRDRPLSFQSAGWADLGRRRPIDEETLFELGSIGKTFTARLLLPLAEEGVLDLEAPVTTYLPWFEVRSECDPIAVRHLLTHSAGIIRGADITADSRFDVWALRETETGFAPGERYYYSNVGFRVLGCVLEEVTGVPYPDLLRTRVLEPLGLSSSEPAITTEIRSRLAIGYDRLHDDRPISPDDPLFPAPWLETGTADGSLAATAGDLATFGRFLLKEGADSLMARPRIDSGDGWSYGYGLEVRTEGGRRLFRHGGSMPGFGSTVLGDFDAGLAVAALLNGPDEHDVTDAVASYALELHRGGSTPAPPGDPEETPPGSLTGDPREEWSAFYGRFRSYNPWLPGFRIVQRGEELVLAYPWGGQEDPLTPLEDARFRVGEAWSPERLRFDAVVDGRALRANLSGADYYRSDFRVAVTRGHAESRSATCA
jgi:CubicO group peptidase (beta-lactamase class C family)